jgi:hypothetical protein
MHQLVFIEWLYLQVTVLGARLILELDIYGSKSKVPAAAQVDTASQELLADTLNELLM